MGILQKDPHREWHLLILMRKADWLVQDAFLGELLRVQELMIFMSFKRLVSAVRASMADGDSPRDWPPTKRRSQILLSSLERHLA